MSQRVAYAHDDTNLLRKRATAAVQQHDGAARSLFLAGAAKQVGRRLDVAAVAFVDERGLYD